MDILEDLNNLHSKWCEKGGKSGDDKYEDALYDCINELADVILKYENQPHNPSLKADKLTKCQIEFDECGVNFDEEERFIG